MMKNRKEEEKKIRRCNTMIFRFSKGSRVRKEYPDNASLMFEKNTQLMLPKYKNVLEISKSGNFCPKSEENLG